MARTLTVSRFAFFVSCVLSLALPIAAEAATADAADAAQKKDIDALRALV